MQAPMRRAPAPADQEAARKLFYAGFVCLPFLWLVNVIHYRAELKSDSAPNTMKDHIRWSAYAFAFVMSCWIVWLIVYYTQLSSGGSNGWARSLLLWDTQKQSW